MNDSDLAVSCLTLGDHERVTGGYLYHLRMSEMAPSHGVRWAFAAFPERPFMLSAAAGGRVLTTVAAQHPDVVLLDSIAAAHVAPWIAAWPPAAPLVAILHQPPGGIDHGFVKTRLLAALDLLVYRRARHLVVASAALADEAIRAGMPEERLTVVAPGRDVAADGAPPYGDADDIASGRHADRPADLRQGRRTALLCVANWVPRKGILQLLDAIGRLPQATATLHLVGDDRADPPYRHAVMQRLSHADVAGRVVVHGPVPRRQVAAFYRASDVFVLASTKEPYGTVYGEAMAAGLPVVGWDAGNLPNLARTGLEGFVVRPGDVPALAAALLRLADDEGARERMGDLARQRAQAFPTWDDSAAALFATLRAAAACPRGRRGRRQ